MTMTKPQGRGRGSQPPSSQPLVAQLGSGLACQTFIYDFEIEKKQKHLKMGFSRFEKNNMSTMFNYFLPRSGIWKKTKLKSALTLWSP